MTIISSVLTALGANLDRVNENGAGLERERIKVLVPEYIIKKA